MSCNLIEFIFNLVEGRGEVQRLGFNIGFYKDVSYPWLYLPHKEQSVKETQSKAFTL
jgi:hypothetical protein